MAKSKSKRKKKVAPKRAAKLSEALKRNTIRLKELCDLLECRDLFDELKKEEKYDIYLLTRKITKFQQKGEVAVPDRTLKFFSQIFNRLSRHKIWEIGSPDKIISTLDALIIHGMIIFMTLHLSNETKKAKFSDTIERLKVYFKDYDMTVAKIYQILYVMMCRANVPTKKMYLFELEHKKIMTINTKNKGLFIECMIEAIEPRKRYIKISGAVRPIFELGWINLRREWEGVTVKSRQLASIYRGNKPSLKVYIQSHAYQRLCERVVPLHPSFVNHLFYNSFNLKSSYEMRIFDNGIHFVYSWDKTKLGYFVADIIAEKIVIRTFFLATHEGMPEGKKFIELTGMTKYDMNYWNINKLSTFINNEMPEDNELYPYFKQSGLLPLFELKKDAIQYKDLEDSEMDWDALNAYVTEGQEHLSESEEEFDY